MFKRIAVLTAFSIALLTACFRKVDPAVETFYFYANTADEMNQRAFSMLYEQYTQSDKSKEYYEIIARRNGKFIVNYCPDRELLTVCEDQGSGWSCQAKNVSESQFKRIVDLALPLDQINAFVYRDTILEDVSPIIMVKTNGSPRL